ncbi:MAG: EF-P lysine aminoacylase GenX [Desulfarculaceae bacterium]|nr:EF-P lysine aminoacylase GenX [Desulfarculaceae bacterium]
MTGNLEKRAAVIQAVRDYFIRNRYLEVQTPIRLPDLIPEAHIDPFESEGWFLQASPELCMKRLMAKGHEKIFQVCPCFRKNERGKLHLPEHTLLEWYAKDQTYHGLMRTITGMIRHVAKITGNESCINYQGATVDITGEFPRLSVTEAFDRYGSIPMEEALETGRFDEIISMDIEPNLGFEKPVFLYDFPAALGSLARLKPGNPESAERFECYIAGLELANGFSELTDPEEQRLRFEKEIEQRAQLEKSSAPMPEKFLADLENMPECAGAALGVDRLVMLFGNFASIDEAVAFKPESL